MVVRPVKDSNGQVSANTTFLTPAFEAARARLLDMPLLESPSIVEWQEHWSPYSTLRSSSAFEDFHSSASPEIMVDGEMRDFIQRGLSMNNFNVHGLSGAVEAVRQTKSPIEISILRAVNTATVEAIRQMRKCLTPNLTENDVHSVLDSTLRAADLIPFFNLVLFDSDASNPHGGTNGNAFLTSTTFVLIDVGAHFHGYSSDVTRTFFPPFLPKTSSTMRLLRPKINVWYLVYLAQTASIAQFLPGATAASIDIAARTVIEDSGYGDAFTHRLGHGIGLKAHESPYLNKGNLNTTLETGMVFTSEPGIYLVGEFGVRHEDVFVIGAEGEAAECLSGKRAVGPWDP